LRQKGRLPLGAYVRCRVRYFCDGAVVGSRAYVEEVFRTYRTRFGPKRKSGARRMKGLADTELYTLRDLRLGVFG
jgi:putative transposase